MRRFVSMVLVMVAAGGCAREGPPSAGGKPIDFWIKAVDSPDAAIRRKAALKLGNVGPMHEGALPALLKALKDTDPQVRREAILAVAKFREAGEDAVPALQRIRDHDEDGHLQELAGLAMKRIRTH